MLFAKTKGSNRNPAQHRILASDDAALEQFDFYFAPNIIGKVPFNPDKKLESEEWYYVQLNQERIEQMIKPYTDNERRSGDLNNTVQSEYQTIEVVYRVIGSHAIFTKITDSYRIKNRTIVKLYDLEQAKVIRESSSIEFNGEVHAYFDGSNRLYFRNFSKVRSMFPGLDDFYRDATREEKQRFLDSPIFTLGAVELSAIGQNDSKRIAVVLNDTKIDFESSARQEKIIDSARHFSEEIELDVTSDGKIVLDEPVDVKKALNVIMSKYYISEVTGEKMESYGSSAINKAEES